MLHATKFDDKREVNVKLAFITVMMMVMIMTMVMMNMTIYIHFNILPNKRDNYNILLLLNGSLIMLIT